MDMTTITTAYNGLKMAKDVFIGFAELKLETESLEKINDAVKKVGEAQDALFQLREELFRLQEENNTLKSNISEREEWKKRLENYDLVETDGGAVVYKSKEGTEHFVCPSCPEKRELHILQDKRAYSGSYECPGCGKSFPIKPIKKLGQPQPDSNW